MEIRKMKFNTKIDALDYKEFFEDDIAQLDSAIRMLTKIKKEFEAAVNSGSKDKLKSVAISLNLRGEKLSGIATSIKKEMAKN